MKVATSMVLAQVTLCVLCNAQTLNLTNMNTTATLAVQNISCSSLAQSYSFEIPTIYTIVSMSVIFLCSIFYYIKLVLNRQVYVKHGSIKSYIKSYLTIGWKFKSMYGSVFTQLFDQISDISVILQLYYLSNDENNDNDNLNVTCYHMNTYYLFVLSLSVFLFYRCYSSFLIYRLLSDSHSPFMYKIFLTILQFVDLSFIITLKINYKFQNTTPCNPQRYITNLESIFEAAPQFIIQLYFIITLNMKENNYDDNYNTQQNGNTITTNAIVIISLFFGLLSIVSNKLSHDKEVVNLEWQNIQFLWKGKDKKKWERLQEKYPTNITFRRCNCSINGKYLNRLLWRLFVVLHRLILLFLIWRIIGGFWLIAIVSFEIVFYAIIYYFTRKTVFLELIMGYVLHQIKFLEKYKQMMGKDDEWWDQYIVLSTIVYAIVLCVCFAMSSVFVLEWFAMLGIFCLPCCIFFILQAFRDHLIGQHSHQIVMFLVIWLLICRHIVFTMFLVLFGFYVFISLISVDLIVAGYHSMHMKNIKNPYNCNAFDHFARLCVTICSTRKQEFTIFYFRSICDIFYCLCLVFVVFYSSSINVLFVNGYDDTIENLFWYNSSGNRDSTKKLYNVLFIFCCVSSIILPFWTRYLVFREQMVNENVTNEHKLSSMSLSGDIYGICEIGDFAGVTNHNNDNGNNELKKYLEKCIRSHNFLNTVFVSLSFLQQYQIMKYLNDNYNIKIPFKLIETTLKSQISSKEFVYQFKNNRILLNSYVNDCIEHEYIKLFWKYMIIKNDFNIFYSMFLENSINTPPDLLVDNSPSIRVDDLSPGQTALLVDFTEQKLDNSEHSKTIKSLLFSSEPENQLQLQKELESYSYQIMAQYCVWIDESGGKFLFEKVRLYILSICLDTGRFIVIDCV